MSPRCARNDGRRPALARNVLLIASAIGLLLAYPVAAHVALQRWGAGSVLVVAVLALPPVAINVALALRFGATLRRGHEPIISRFARIERGVLEPDLAAYTRTLTLVWVIFFAVMATVSIVLSVPSPQRAWQLWTGIGNWLCVALLLMGERIYRHARFPHYRHASLMRQLRVAMSHWRG